MLGIRLRGQLIASLALQGVMTLDEAQLTHAITGSLITLHHAEPVELVAVVQTIAVHPDWRDDRLTDHLLTAALDLPMVRTADHVFAQIAAAHDACRDSFLRHGFGIVAATLEPSDLQPRFILQKPALGFALHELASAEDVNPLPDFSTIMRLTEREALIGRPDDLKPARLAFHASRDLAASWNEEPYGVAREG